MWFSCYFPFFFCCPFFFQLIPANCYDHISNGFQDVFGAIPGDTDYRMFARDYGDIPGLDIIFLLGGYFYHTSSDTVERLLYALKLVFCYSSVNCLFRLITYASTFPDACKFLQAGLEASKHEETI